jgi:hypothetical protein
MRAIDSSKNQPNRRRRDRAREVFAGRGVPLGVSHTGATSAAALATIESAFGGVASRNASCAVVALSPGDDGLFSADDAADAAAVADAFLGQVLADADAAAAGVAGVVAVANALPDGRATPDHLAELVRVNAALAASAYPVLDFWNATAAADGTWRNGTSAGDALPNDAGHGLLFRAANASLGLFLGDAGDGDGAAR